MRSKQELREEIRKLINVRDQIQDNMFGLPSALVLPVISGFNVRIETLKWALGDNLV